MQGARNVCPTNVFAEQGLNSHIYCLRGVFDPTTFQLSYTPDAARKLPVGMFTRGYT